MGEIDGLPKAPKYVFQLHMALEHFEEASQTV